MVAALLLLAAMRAQLPERASTTCAVGLCSRLLEKRQAAPVAGDTSTTLVLTHGTLRDEHSVQEVSSEPLMTRDLVVTERESEPFSS